MKKLIAIVSVLMAMAVASAQWEAVEKIDPITDESRLILRYGNPSDINQAFILRFSGEDEIEAYVFPGGFFTEANAMVTIRFDKDVPIESRCLLSGDGTALFFQIPDLIWLKTKVAKERIVIRAVDYSGEVITFIIPREGLDEIMLKHIERLVEY
jgi:hypothetical protein